LILEIQTGDTATPEALAGQNLNPADWRTEQSNTVLSKLLIQTCV
jgi:hypothetical protein